MDELDEGNISAAAGKTNIGRISLAVPHLGLNEVRLDDDLMEDGL